MKRFLALSITAIFMLGVLFPISRTSEGKSAFVQQIKKIFHFSSGSTGKAPKAKKRPLLRGEGGSALFQEIRNVFHYFPEDTERPKSKKYPPRLDRILQKELRYPAEEK